VNATAEPGPASSSPLGLSRVPTHQLESVASGIERDSLRFPLTAARLRAAGVSALVDHLPMLKELSPPQTLALLRCVLAERARQTGPALELVWTGPDVPETVIRDTALVVRDLFASATTSVLVGGCYFSGGEHILEPLYEAIRDRGVRATFCLNIPEPAPDVASIPAHVRAQVRSFLARNWPFGLPLPDFYYDPRTVQPLPPGRVGVLLHSKCVVIDERRAFITSANFTHNGQARNIETGVQIDDEKFARELAGHWHSLIRAGLLAPCEVGTEDVAASDYVHHQSEWEALRDDIPPEYAALFDALRTHDVPAPSDAQAELVWQGRVSAETAWLCWETPSGTIGLAARGARADNLITIETAPDDDPKQLALEIQRRLGELA
jgi:phosphatidylserine/phosphatidylglycerophosphate/cardiolipin synthase-like enzyme